MTAVVRGSTLMAKWMAFSAFHPKHLAGGGDVTCQPQMPEALAAIIQMAW